MTIDEFLSWVAVGKLCVLGLVLSAIWFTMREL